LHGGPAEVEIGTLKDEMVLEEVALPVEDIWKKACERAKAIFGVPTSPLLNATNLASLADQLTEKVKAHSPDVVAIANRIADVKLSMFAEMQACPRLETAPEAQSLLRSLSSASGNEVVKHLAKADLKSNHSALGASISNPGTVDRALESADWKIFQGNRGADNERKAETDKIWEDLETAFKSDEYAVALAPKITALKGRAVDLLTRQIAPPPPERPEPPLPPKTVTELKELYGKSQVERDDLPDWVGTEMARDVLKVYFFGNPAADADDWKSMIVVSPTVKVPIDLDPDATVDLRKRTLVLPRYRQTLKLTVDPQHLE
jgi:hypothetical protein